MGKLIKWLLGAAVTVILLVGLAIAAVVMFFDPNDYRDDIALALGEATGRTVTLDGELTLSVFPWLAIETTSVTVSNAPGFGDAPMLSIGRARAGVRLGALLSGKVDVDTVTISDLQLRLAVDSRGGTNWQDLAGDQSTSATSAEAAPSDVPDISVAGINIENALIEYRDAGTGADYQLREFDMRLGGVDFNQPVPITASFAFTSAADELTGRAEVDTRVVFERDAEGVLNAVALSDSEFAGEVTMPALAAAQSFRLSAASITAGAGADASLTLDDAKFEFGGVEASLSLTGTSAPMRLNGAFAVSPFSPREVMETLTGTVLDLTDADAMQAASLSGQLALTDDSAALTDLDLAIDATTLTGRLSVAGFSAPAIRFDLAGSAINLDGYLPPADEEVSDDAGDNLAESALPVDLIQGLDARGEFRMREVVLGDLPFNDLSVGLVVGGDKARLAPIQATVLNGGYTGDVIIDASGDTPRLSLNETVDGLDMGALAKLLYEKDNIEGTLAGNFKLSGRGTRLSEVRRSLDGDVVFSLTDGALIGTDIWYQIRRARAAFRQEAQPPAPNPARTEFTELRGSATVSNGVARNDDLFAALPFLQLTGSGSADLADGTVDYTMQARVLERPEFLEGVTPEELDEYTEAVIPLKITGDMTAPTIRPDIAGMAEAAAKRKLDEERERAENRLRDRLKDKEDELKKRLKDIF
ncbi:MAG: AsmA family protein [Pseudomonadota bacterium]